MTDIARTAPAVDCHAHVFTTGMPLAPGAWTSPAADATVEHYLALLDEAGIGRAVLAASSLHGDDNHYAMAATRAHPRLRSTVIVPPDTTIGRLRELDAWGACGIRLQLRNKDLPDLTSAAYRRLFRHVADLGWHVQLHDDARRLPPMIEAIESSGARLVIDHFGRPGPEGLSDPGFHAVLRAVGRGRTWVKIAAAFRLEPPTLDRSLSDALLAVAGPERLLWGSDWPFVGFEQATSYSRALADFERAVPDMSTREAIGRTALHFYFGEA